MTVFVPPSLQTEARDLKDLGIEAASVSEPELKLARQLIDHLGAQRFDPNEYADEHKVRVQAAIQRKVDGKEISMAESPISNKGGNVIDLMEALRASIDARGSKAAGIKERKAPKRAAAQASSRKTARR